MIKSLRLPAICSLLFILLTWSSLPAQPVDIDWELLKQYQLSAAPLDIAASADGKLFFVLTPGQVAVYSDFADQAFKQIPVDMNFERLMYSDSTSTLILTSATTHTIKIMEIDLVHKISVEGSPFKGPKNAAVTLAVFDDYQCPYCAQLETLFQQVLEKYPDDVKLVVKHFPIRSHNMALKGALAALSANNQGKFWEFHTKLFENFRSLSDQKIEEIATELNLDMQKFLKDQQTPAVKNLIFRDVQNAHEIGVNATPTLFINGKRVKNRSLDNLSGLIEKELRKKR
jgi:predicted DsbA family dithiol-disulfide isomerase